MCLVVLEGSYQEGHLVLEGSLIVIVAISMSLYGFQSILKFVLLFELRDTVGWQNEQVMRSMDVQVWMHKLDIVLNLFPPPSLTVQWG